MNSNFQHMDKRPSSQEGYELLSEIVRRHKLDYVAKSFHVSIAEVAHWMHKSQDIFTRMKYFLRDLNEDGHEDLAIRLTQLFCAAIGRESVPAAPKKVSFLSLMQAITRDNKESADVQLAWCNMIDDQIATTEEIEKAIKEVHEQIEAAYKVKTQLEFLFLQASQNDGKIILDMQTLRRSILDTATT